MFLVPEGTLVHSLTPQVQKAGVWLENFMVTFGALPTTIIPCKRGTIAYGSIPSSLRRKIIILPRFF